MAKMRVGIVLAASRRSMKCRCSQRRISWKRLINRASMWFCWVLINRAVAYQRRRQLPAQRTGSCPHCPAPFHGDSGADPGREAQQLINAESGQPLAAIDVIFPIVHGTLGEDGSLQDAAHGESAVRRLRCAGLCGLYGQRRDQTSAARRRARRRPVYHTHPRQPRAVQLCRCRSEAWPAAVR